MYRNLLKVLSVCLFALAVLPVSAQMPPPSPVIKSIQWAPSETIVRRAKGGDNWPITWADDDRLYSTYGDGWGFAPKVAEKLSLGFSRIDGRPPSFQGVNIRSRDEQKGQGRRGKKSWGLLCVDGVLYMWLGHADRAGGQSQLAWSMDHARTWTFADWKLPEFGLIGFVNFGRNYDGARDDYVYAVSHDGPRADTPADGFVLMRAKKDDLARREGWEFHAGLGDDFQPVWTKDVTKRSVVVERPGASLRSGISYNAGIRRYLWWQQIPLPAEEPDRGDTRFQGGFLILDAAEPWGPWTTAFHTDAWDVGPGEHGVFPTKWMSSDGKTLHLVFSGDDCFCVRKATVRLHE